MTTNLHPVNVKINVVGDEVVGKTSIIHRFVDDQFREGYLPTLGFEIMLKKLLIDNIMLNFSIWDMGGQQCFDTVRFCYYQGSMGFLLVFNLAFRVTLRNINNWFTDIRKICPEAPIIIIANKSDLQNPACTDQEIREEANQIGALGYMKTSAKSGEGIESAFKLLGNAIIQKFLSSSAELSQKKNKE